MKHYQQLNWTTVPHVIVPTCHILIPMVSIACFCLCQTVIVVSVGSRMKVRALLDWVSSTLFIIEHLTRWLKLLCHHQNIHVTGIGSKKHGLFLSFVVSFTVTNLKLLNTGKVCGPWWKVEAIVLLKVTTELPTFPVPFDRKCKHLSGLSPLDWFC